MKIAFRNFLTTLRRYKASSLLNIAGLSLAFTAFYIILVQVYWEATYNRRLRDADRIYLVSPYDEDEASYGANTNRPDGERLIASSPEIEAGGAIRLWYDPEKVWVRRNEFGFDSFTASINCMTTGFLETIRFEGVEGDLSAVARLGAVALARSVARKMSVGVGDVLWTAARDRSAEPRPGRQWEVVALYDDFPDNSLFGRLEGVRDLGTQDLESVNDWNDYYFVRLREGADPEAVARRWERIHADNYRQWAAEMNRLWTERFGEEAVSDRPTEDACACRLFPLDELYYNRRIRSSALLQGSPATTLSLAAVALLVIFIALINFVNFFFALMPVRLRTVNIFKVFGAPTSSLRFSFVFEAVGFVVCALLVAWYASFAFRSMHFANYISTSLAVRDNLPVAGIVAGVAVLAALVAGIYPAWYITSFSPALAAKGTPAGSSSGRRLRTVLIAAQYVVSTALIVITFFCYAQQRFVRRFDMGFDRERVLTFESSPKVASDYFAFVSRLESDPRIEAVTASMSPFVLDSWTVWGREIKGTKMDVHVRYVRSNFLDVMRIPIVAGEGFRPQYDRDSLERVVFNDLTRRRCGIEPGDSFDGMPVAGICRDLHFRPLQYDSEPLAFVTSRAPMKHFYLRVAAGADIAGVGDHIRAVIRETDPRCDPPDLCFMDAQIDREYGKEMRLATIIALFALLSVAIALMGVFGIVLLETQHRCREIAVRKVLGATTGEILAMFNRRYIALTLVCFVVAAPVAWYVAERWLSSFAYRIPIGAGPFLAALAAVLLVTVATVTVRSLAVVRENPADAVKTE